MLMHLYMSILYGSLQMHKCMYMYTYVYIYIHIHGHGHRHVYVYVDVDIYLYMYRRRLSACCAIFLRFWVLVCWLLGLVFISFFGVALWSLLFEVAVDSCVCQHAELNGSWQDTVANVLKFKNCC